MGEAYAHVCELVPRELGLVHDKTGQVEPKQVLLSLTCPFGDVVGRHSYSLAVRVHHFGDLTREAFEVGNQVVALATHAVDFGRGFPQQPSRPHVARPQDGRRTPAVWY